MTPPRLERGTTAVLLVDVQERLLAKIHNHEQVVHQAGRLLDIARVLDLPVIVTEQYRKGLGPTVPALAERLKSPSLACEKMRFSSWEPAVREHVARLGATRLLILGIEAHVCVLQTCLDVAGAGLTAAVVADAIGSRQPQDQEVALLRMVQAGVVPTTVESAALELLGEAGTPTFKAVLDLIK